MVFAFMAISCEIKAIQSFFGLTKPVMHLITELLCRIMIIKYMVLQQGTIKYDKAKLCLILPTSSQFKKLLMHGSCSRYKRQVW